MRPGGHCLEPWAKPTPPWVSLAGWLLSARLRAAQKGLRLGPGQQPLLGAAQFPGPRQGSLMETQSELPLEAQSWAVAARGTLVGATRTAPTSTRTMREPPSAALLRWRGWTWICARMRGERDEAEVTWVLCGQIMSDSSFVVFLSPFALLFSISLRFSLCSLLLCDLVTGSSAS